MVCEKCFLEINDNTVPCPRCGYVDSGGQQSQNYAMSQQKKKISTAIKVLIITGCAFVALFILGTIIGLISAASAEPPYVQDMSVEKQEVSFGDIQYLFVTFANDSSRSTDATFDIIMDGKVMSVENCEFDENEQQLAEYSAEGLEVGSHYFQIGEQRIDFEVIPYNDFEIGIMENQDILITGAQAVTAFYVENVGPLMSLIDVQVKFNDETVLQDTLELASKQRIENTVDYTVGNEESITISVNDEQVTIPIYQSTTIKHGTKLMENTVKGYGYIMIDNKTDRDTVVYLAKNSDPNQAVAARYVTSGKEHKLNSIVHGEYILVLQTGSQWVADLNRFAYNNERFAVNGVLEIDNNVSKSSGGVYTYYEIDIDTAFINDYCTPVDSSPSLD